MRLYLLSFGKLRTPGLREAFDYYHRNLQPWVGTQEIELKASPVLDKSDASKAAVREKDSLALSQKLEQLLSPRGCFYLLDERGKPLSTQGWAELVESWEGSAVPEVALCTGASLGFSEALRKKARAVLSLGPQTLSHDLAKVVLAEQLYRAWSVVRKHPYHNE